MKVGLVIDDHMARPGGVQEYVRGLYRYLRHQGHDVIIFSSGGGYPADNLQIMPLGPAFAFQGNGSSTSIPLTFMSAKQLRKVLEREACDVLHVMAPYSPTLSGRLVMQSKSLNVLTFLVASEPGLRRAVLGVLAKAQRRSLRRFHVRLAISPTAAATGRALYGGQYHIIPTGVNTSQFTPDAVPLPGFRDDCINLLYAGRLEQRKGVVYLVRAYARLQRQYPNLRLVIAGDGPERRPLEQLVLQLGLERVCFLGYVPADDLPRVFASADVFCAPATHAESFGIVLTEAFAAALPVVAAANAGYAGLLAAHAGNMLVRPADDRALAGALAALIEQPAYRREVGARNRVAAARYEWQSIGREVVALYEEGLRERRHC